MKFLIADFIFVLVLLCCFASNAVICSPSGASCGSKASASIRIINGKSVKTGQYPWLVSLRTKDDNHICGGSIIDDQWILTSAQCFISSDNPSLYLVRARGADAGKSYTVEKVIKHEHFLMPFRMLRQDIARTRNDIALVKIVGTFADHSSSMNRICLPVTSHPIDDSKAAVITIAGWGYGSGDDDPYEGDSLSQADLIGQTDDYCKAKWGAYHWADDGQMMCAMSPNKSPCIGDNGGPAFLMLDGQMTQVGIISFYEMTCLGGPRPPAFTRVAFYLDWIHKTIAAN